MVLPARRKRRLFWALAVPLTCAGACASSDNDVPPPAPALEATGEGMDLPGMAKAGEVTTAMANPKPEDEDDDSDEDIDDALAAADEEGEREVSKSPKDATISAIPTESNADVRRWVEYFTGKDRERFQRFLDRGEKYKPAVLAVLKDQGMPLEIYYQAMIESGFATAATSRASAVGIWQFVRGTGRRYGLRVDGYVDERRDPLRATIAAALYLKDLYNVFQSWHLALAAYNSGEGRVVSAIMRSKTRDYWQMARDGALPEETCNYVPKFLAAAMIGADPRHYGFEDPKPQTRPALVSVEVASPVRLSDVAAVAGVPLNVLKEHNPHLLRGITPPGVPTYRLWIPKDLAPMVEGQAERLADLRLKGLRQTAAVAGGGSKYHKVASGESLAEIARQYGLSTRQLKRMNHLRTNRVRPGTTLTVVPSDGGAVSRYRVKRGENLDAIARRFGVSVDDLKRINHLRHSRVLAGQVLRIAG